MKHHCIFFILISLLGLLVYSNTIYSPFHWDDYPNIVENRSLLHPLRFKEIAAHWPTRFFLFWTFALNYSLSGLNLLSYHLTNISIHIAAAIFIYLLIFESLSQLGQSNGLDLKKRCLVAGLASLLFVVHPVATGAVTYLVQRGVSLASALGLLSLLLYIKARNRIMKKGQSFFSPLHFFLYCLSVLCICLALLTKEVALVFPFLIIAWEFIFGRRTKESRLLTGYLIPFLIPLLILPALSILTVKAGLGRDDFFYRVNIPWRPLPVIFKDGGDTAALNNCWEYFVTQLNSVAVYIRLSFFPVRQNFYYDLPACHSIFAENSIFLLMIYLALIITGVKLVIKPIGQRLMGWGIIWFFFCLIPTSSILILWPFLSEYHLYLSLAGFSFFLAGFLLAMKRQPYQRVSIYLSLVIIFLFALLSWNRNLVYLSAISLWDDTVRKSPKLAPARSNLAAAYIARGYFKKAVEESKMALELNPYFDGYQNLWASYRHLGKLKEAEEAAREHIKNFPENCRGYYELALIHRDKKEYEDAERMLEKALEINPDFSSGWNDLGILYQQVECPAKARDSFINALKKDSRSVPAHYNLGVLYWRTYGDYNAARHHLRQALKFSSNPAFKKRVELILLELKKDEK